MTIITKPISEKKFSEKKDIINQPLVENEVVEHGLTKSGGGEADIESNSSRQYVVLRTRAHRISAATTVCVFITALLVMSLGIIGGVYLYKQLHRGKYHSFRGWCSVPFDQATYLNLKHVQPDKTDTGFHALFQDIRNPNSGQPVIRRKFFQEEFEVDTEYDAYERIDVPDFSSGRRGRFVHDFSNNKTGIVDIEGNRCFMMPLDREHVLPPKSLSDLMRKVMNGYYKVDTEILHETVRVIIPPVDDVLQFSSYIARECKGRPTYRLERVTRPIVKREIHEDKKYFAEFAGKKIVQFDIINLDEIPEGK